jgi:hypothetical protein
VDPVIEFEPDNNPELELLVDPPNPPRIPPEELVDIFYISKK